MSSTATVIETINPPIKAPDAPKISVETKNAQVVSARADKLAKIVSDYAAAEPVEPARAPDPTKPDESRASTTTSTGDTVKPAVDGTTKPIGGQLASALRKEAEANRIAREAKEIRKVADERLKEAQEALDFARRFKEDPFALLEKQDPLAYQKYTERKLTGKIPQQPDPKFAEYEKRISEYETRLKGLETEATTAKERAAKAEAMEQIREATRGEEFEVFRAIKGADATVLESALEHYKKTQEAPAWTDFAKAFQAELIGQLTPILQTKEGQAIVRKLMGDTSSTQDPKVATEPLKTVTNQTASGAPAPRPTSRISRDQLVKQIIADAVSGKQ